MVRRRRGWCDTEERVLDAAGKHPFESQRLLDKHEHWTDKDSRSAGPRRLMRSARRRRPAAAHPHSARAQAGEHAHCGRGVLASGFSYEAGAFAAAGVEVAAVGWRDMGVPTLLRMLEVVQARGAPFKDYVHTAAHAGGRAGARAVSRVYDRAAAHAGGRASARRASRVAQVAARHGAWTGKAGRVDQPVAEAQQACCARCLLPARACGPGAA